MRVGTHAELGQLDPKDKHMEVLKRRGDVDSIIIEMDKRTTGFVHTVFGGGWRAMIKREM